MRDRLPNNDWHFLIRQRKNKPPIRWDRDFRDIPAQSSCNGLPWSWEFSRRQENIGYWDSFVYTKKDMENPSTLRDHTLSSAVSQIHPVDLRRMTRFVEDRVEALRRDGTRHESNTRDSKHVNKHDKKSKKDKSDKERRHQSPRRYGRAEPEEPSILGNRLQNPWARWAEESSAPYLEPIVMSPGWMPDNSKPRSFGYISRAKARQISHAAIPRYNLPARNLSPDRPWESTSSESSLYPCNIPQRSKDDNITLPLRPNNESSDGVLDATIKEDVSIHKRKPDQEDEQPDRKRRKDT